MIHIARKRCLLRKMRTAMTTKWGSFFEDLNSSHITSPFLRFLKNTFYSFYISLQLLEKGKNVLLCLFSFQKNAIGPIYPFFQTWTFFSTSPHFQFIFLLTSNQTIEKIYPVPMKLLYFLCRSITEAWRPR